MKLTYDPERNVAYIRPCWRSAEVETLRISDELNVDMAPAGTVYGIELLNANEQLAGSDGRRLVEVAEPGRATREVALT